MHNQFTCSSNSKSTNSTCRNLTTPKLGKETRNSSVLDTKTKTNRRRRSSFRLSVRSAMRQISMSLFRSSPRTLWQCSNQWARSIQVLVQGLLLTLNLKCTKVQIIFTKQLIKLWPSKPSSVWIQIICRQPTEAQVKMGTKDREVTTTS